MVLPIAVLLSLVIPAPGVSSQKVPDVQPKRVQYVIEEINEIPRPQIPAALDMPAEQVLAVSPKGLATGFATDPSHRTFCAFLFRDGKVIAIDLLPRTDRAWGRAVNDRGEVAGVTGNGHGESRAFLYSGGKVIDLGTLGGQEAAAFDLNNRGEATGWTWTKDGATHAFLYRPKFGMTDLGVLPNTTVRDKRSMGISINDVGQVVGFSNTDGGYDANHAVLWHDGQTIDLNDLLPANSGWVLELAVKIQKDGTILGGGKLNGKPAKFKLTPKRAEKRAKGVL